jgi:hypothetical protein
VVGHLPGIEATRVNTIESHPGEDAEQLSVDIVPVGSLDDDGEGVGRWRVSEKQGGKQQE